MRVMNAEAHTAMGIVKVPALSAALAMGINAFVMGNTDMTVNTYFGLAVFAGNLAADQLAKRVLPNSDFKAMETRAIEIGGTSALTFALNRYLLNADGAAMAVRTPVQTVGTIAVSRAGAEMLAGMIPM